MYIVNEHGITHSIPDDWKLPPKARRASKDEIAAYEGASVAPIAPEAAPNLELANTVAERDAEIARLTAALAEASAHKGKGKG